MTDEQTLLADLRWRVKAFADARDWGQYHTPKSLSVSIAIEAAELMEHFQWLTEAQAAATLKNRKKRAAVADELADVIIYALRLADVLDVDLSDAVLDKLARNEQRFPIEEWRGRAE